jgi:hypothetical protein
MSHLSQIGLAVEDNGGLPAADSPDPVHPAPAPAAIVSSNKEPRGRPPSHRTIVDAICRGLVGSAGTYVGTGRADSIRHPRQSGTIQTDWERERGG